MVAADGAVDGVTAAIIEVIFTFTAVIMTAVIITAVIITAVIITALASHGVITRATSAIGFTPSCMPA